MGQGTAQCHDGDRPWLAGGKKDEVFLATNTPRTTPEPPDLPSHRRRQHLLVDRHRRQRHDGRRRQLHRRRQALLRPPTRTARRAALYFDATATASASASARGNRGDAAFTPAQGRRHAAMFAHWPAIALDAADNVYLVWDTDPRDTTGHRQRRLRRRADARCPTTIKMARTRRTSARRGRRRSRSPHPANGRAFWPWIAAGDAGKVSVVWYQTDKVADLDCQAVEHLDRRGDDPRAPTRRRPDDRHRRRGRPRRSTRRHRLPGRDDLRGHRPGPPARRLLHELARRARLRDDRHAATRPRPTRRPGRPGRPSLPIFLRQDSGPALRRRRATARARRRASGCRRRPPR